MKYNKKYTEIRKYRHTDIRTDISNYRVTSLLKKMEFHNLILT